MRAIGEIILGSALCTAIVLGLLTAVDCGLMPGARVDCRNGDRTACAFVADHPVVDTFVAK